MHDQYSAHALESISTIRALQKLLLLPFNVDSLLYKTKPALSIH